MCKKFCSMKDCQKFSFRPGVTDGNLPVKQKLKVVLTNKCVVI